MKRNLFALLTLVVTMGTIAMPASARQVSFGDLRADLNGDGEVSLIELITYNQAQRNN